MKISVVIVTYNRLEKLKTSLNAYDKQSFHAYEILVVNNASSDGTKSYLDEWKTKNHPYSFSIINSSENLGGSGGFSLGLKYMMSTDCDFIYIADDDAYPDVHMLENLKNGIEKNNNISAFCSKVVYKDGSIQLSHRRRIKKRLFHIKDVKMSEKFYSYPSFELDCLSFVGACIKREVVSEVGLPCIEYFIQYDDTDYSLRIRKLTKILCITDSIIVHDIQKETYPKTSWKTYYAYRNKLLLIKKHFGIWYYFFSYCYRLISIFRHFNDKLLKQIKIDAAHDSRKNIWGKNTRYQPGIDPLKRKKV